MHSFQTFHGQPIRALKISSQGTTRNYRVLWLEILSFSQQRCMAHDQRRSACTTVSMAENTLPSRSLNRGRIRSIPGPPPCGISKPVREPQPFAIFSRVEMQSLVPMSLRCEPLPWCLRSNMISNSRIIFRRNEEKRVYRCRLKGLKEETLRPLRERRLQYMLERMNQRKGA